MAKSERAENWGEGLARGIDYKKRAREPAKKTAGVKPLTVPPGVGHFDRFYFTN